VRIHFPAEHALELDLADLCLELGQVRFDPGEGRRIVFGFGHLEQFERVGNGMFRPVELGQLLFELGALAPQLLGAFRLVPDVRSLELQAYFFETFFLAVVFKGTP
jgi:hypothetical protein